MPETMKDQEIITSFKPYWGRAVNADGSFREWLPCDHKGLFMQRHKFVKWRDDSDNGGPECQHCHAPRVNHCECLGTGGIPDPEREIIAEAVGHFHDVTDDAQFVADFRDLNQGDPWRADAEVVAWGNRHGQPWCEPLEAHVRAYRRPVPDLVSDEGCLLLKRLLREKGHIYETGWAANGQFWAEALGKKGFSMEGEPVALRATVVAAIQSTKTK